jgi:hypothetical protein
MTPDREEQARKEHERIMRARERLKFRVYAAVRDVVLGTELFRTHTEFFEPEVVVNVFAQYVDVTTSLSEGQVRLLPVRNRARDLNRFAEELRAGIQRVASDLGLEFALDPLRYGGSQAVTLGDVPSGFRGVLLRRESE